ncbi:putative DNA primase/helicase [Bathymodiolus platifrons methanotrophic gill symbiont]|uniref:DUF5906 domain-containing protein n=1 Tax=Bathymodiolus platifrons methanotrophic gill symbiont TaxID=113268 RepID=UPI000B6AE020|nr:DUF5906 domain-containing protein [Bathymodiolus platifrons methanotrophic gill symbiont]GAW87614.1 putative DNA primase/helicase [Bathymodiolus platifrons methanotrophic gill symbiont]
MNNLQNKTSSEVATTDTQNLVKKTPLGELPSWLDSDISCKSPDDSEQVTSCTVLEALQKITEGHYLVDTYRLAEGRGNTFLMEMGTRKLECCSFLGEFSGSISEENFIPDSCTNTLVVSIDNLHSPEEVGKLKKRISRLPFVRFCFISYSGKGLEIGVHVPSFRNDADIKNIFGAIAKYFKAKLNLTLDTSSNDITRVVRLSKDNEIHINKSAITIDVDNLSTTAYPDLSEDDLNNTAKIIRLRDRASREEEARILEREARLLAEKEEEEAKLLAQEEAKRARLLAQEEAEKEGKGEAASEECERIDYGKGKIVWRFKFSNGEVREFDGRGCERRGRGCVIAWINNPDGKKKVPASSGEPPKNANPCKTNQEVAGSGGKSTGTKPNQDSKGALDDAALKQLVTDMNEEYAVVSLGGKTRVAKRMDNDTYSFQTFADFQNFFSNKTVTVLNDEKYTKVSKAAIWLNSPDRKEYSQGIEFYPTIGDSDRNNGRLNVWSGFGYKRKPYNINRIQPILDYIKDVVCGGNDVYCSYVKGWIAKGFQKPHIPAGTAIVLRGEEGSGKSTLGLILATLWGNSGMIIEDSDHLTGKFNNQLMNCAFLAGNEAVYHGDKKAQSKLKSLVTDTSLMIEGKGVDAIKIRNCLKIILSANDDWA